MPENNQNQLLIAITSLQENMKHVTIKVDEISINTRQVADLSSRTEESTKNAHIRIEDLKREFNEKMQQQKLNFDEKIANQAEKHTKMADNINWLWRTVVAGLIAAGISGVVFLITTL